VLEDQTLELQSGTSDYIGRDESMKSEVQRRDNLDEGIAGIFVLAGATNNGRCATASRFASLAEAAIVTARQFRPVDRGGLSIDSGSSSQSSADSRAWSGPNNSFTAPMNDANSRSARCIWSA
jgi:hypothetical protein